MRPIIGTEAIDGGHLTRGQLRWNYIALYPNVYFPRDRVVVDLDRARAAWLWTGRRSVVAGRAAAGMYGAAKAMTCQPVELISAHARSRPGVVVRNERIGDDEVRLIAGTPVTSAARTALDVARHLETDESVPLLDALLAVADLDVEDAYALMKRYPRARGLPRARAALWLADGKSRCPEESRLRVRLVNAGLPRPRVGIVLGDGIGGAALGMGWDRWKVGVSHRGAHDGGNDPARATREALHHYTVQRLGWMEVQAMPFDSSRDVLFRVRAAIRSRSR
ncbi:hypothetical protein [Mycolicibacterium sediminis]|uniref:AbiEi antitoxin C-terminal domain-containing protein n=1 Tax=Mycolicibacterium sediminis TaxID=1286180 RepID=A0A7I7QZ88_9MYCO|nr:hypothetical protein [Mycolicibacterium sediminis]BBY31651.1 hypothetical protein MSEDJ_57470 [Mycolicibacterium sediminis]